MRLNSSSTRHRLMLILMGFVFCSGLGSAIGALAATLAEKTPLTLPSPPRGEGQITSPLPTGGEGQGEGAVHASRTTLHAVGLRLAGYGRLPLSFEANQGQVDSQVQFLARGRGYTLFLTPTEAVLALRKPSAVSDQRSDKTKTVSGTVVQPESPSEKKTVPDTVLSVLRMKLEGANPAPTVTGLDKLPGIVNYFIGNEPAKWHTNIPTYQKVEYKEVYAGIDLAYYGNQGQLEYDLIVAPGADPNQIKLAFEGADDIKVDSTGNLVAAVNGGEVRLLKPHVYQTIAGKKTEVAANYIINSPSPFPLPPGARVTSVNPSSSDPPNVGAGLIPARPKREGVKPSPTKNEGQGEGVRGHQVSLHVGLQLASYDRTVPLVIDPILDWATYLGTSSGDFGRSIATDTVGAAYVTGPTFGAGFPGTASSTIQSANVADGFFDVFVVKLNPQGTAIVYATYLGSNNGDEGFSIAVDAAGAAYVTGETSTAGSGFPGTASSTIQSTFAGGISDAFVAKLNPQGTAIVYATYLGTTGTDQGHGIAVDAAGAAYVTGLASAGFPGTASSTIQNTFAGASDAFVAKINPQGTGIVYATYLGTTLGDQGNGIAVDAAGAAYVTGQTLDAGFPGTAGSTIQNSHAGASGSFDAFVAKINPQGTAIDYATYLGTGSRDVGNGIAVDAAGATYVTGETRAAGFPGTAGSSIPSTVIPIQSTFMGSIDAFVAKINPQGTAIAYATYLGTTGANLGNAIAVDISGAAYITGSASAGFPGTAGSPIQNTFAGGLTDAFVAKLNPQGTALVFATYLGTTSGDSGAGIALDAVGAAYVTGTTTGPGFPGTVGSPIQSTLAGLQDAFIAKITFTGTPFSWGTNTFGQLGRGNFAPGIAPAPVSGLTNVEAVAGGASHSLALKPATSTASSTIFSWGDNNVGQLGTGNNNPSNVPAPVTGFPVGTIPLAIAAGADHSLALATFTGTASSTAFAWGSNSNGQLGRSPTSTPSSNTPLLVNSLLGAGDVTAIAAGGGHSLALRGAPGSASSTVVAWGENTSGQLGQGSTGGGLNSNPQTVVGPTGLGFLTNVSAIAAGANHSLAIRGALGSASATIFAWGSNSNGQLGTATSSGFNSGVPAPVLGGPSVIGPVSGIVAVAGGNFHSLALESDGDVFAWGRGDLGQLGNGANNQSNTPVVVTGLTNIVAIAAVGNASFALRNDGALFGWGDNSNGQVSNTSCSPTCNVPVQVQGQGGVGSLTNVVAIGQGILSNHTLAISSTAPLANVIVPNVVGLTQAAATTTLTDAGLALGTVTITNNIAPAGQVLTQNPIAGSSVAPGTAVNLTVSSGPVAVPNVVGQSQATATTNLTNAGLALGTVTVANNIAPAGQVLTQNPTAGSSVVPGTAVNLTVSSGPVSVPNVVGQPSSAAADTTLTGAGLTLGTVTSAANIAPVGQVLTQVPLAGTLAVPGTAVNLTVSSLLPPVSVSIDARMLKAAGFTTFEIVGQPGSLDTAVVQNLTLPPSTSAYTLRAPFGGGPGEKTLTFKVNAQCNVTLP